MKKLLFMMMCATMMVMSTTQADAQRQRHMGRRSNDTTQVRRQWDPAKMAEMRVQHMTERYKLTAKQQTALKELFQQQAQTQRPNMPRGKRPKLTKEQRDSINTARKAQTEKFEADMKKILSKEQYAQYKKDLEERIKAFQERRNRMMQRMPMRDGDGGFGPGRQNNNDDNNF